MVVPTSTKTIVTPHSNDSIDKGINSKGRFGRTLLRVEKVCSNETLLLANQDINEAQTVPNIVDGNEIRRVLLRNDLKQPPYSPVYFDNECKLTDCSKLDMDLCYATENLKKLSKEAIETMSSALQWKNTRMDIWVGLLRYQLTPSRPNISNMPWHEDPNIH